MIKIIEGYVNAAAGSYDTTVNLGAKPLCVLLVPLVPSFPISSSYVAAQIPCAVLRGTAMQRFSVQSGSAVQTRLGYLNAQGFTLETQGSASYLGNTLHYTAFIEENV